MTKCTKRFARVAAAAVFCALLAAGSLPAAEKLFDVDINKQKAGLEKDFAQAQEFISQAKLQNARSQVELLEHKLKQMKADLSKDDAASYQVKIDNMTAKIGAKEDSLIKVTMDILNTKGVDPALRYLQNDLRAFGVSEKKTSAAEKTILDEAPKIQQSVERREIDRAVKALQSGQPLDPDMDPYIVRTAQRIIKVHEDSVAAVENAKERKEMEEKQKQERIVKEKEDRERKIEEEKATKIKQEEDKKRLAEQEIARKKGEADEKEKARLAKIEEERQKKLAIQEDKARKDSTAAALKDSIATAQKLAVQKAQEEKQEKARQAKMSSKQKDAERLAKIEGDRQKQDLAMREKAQKDSAAAAQKLAVQQAQQEKEQQRQGAIEEERGEVSPPSKQPAASASAEAQKQRQQEAQELEQQRKLDAQQKETERVARIEEEKNKQEIAQREKIRQDSITRFQAQVAAARKVEKPQQKPQPQQQAAAQPQPQKPQPAPQVAIASRRQAPPEAEAQAPISKAAQDYLQGLRNSRKKAQDMVMDLYDLIDKKMAKDALQKFKQDRAFIAQFVDAQVFNVLEQTISQSVSATPETASAPAAKPAVRVPEQEEIDKINNLMRDNKIEAAYAELKRTESSLKHFMTREDFKQLKNMVESSYKIRKGK